jgi:hypothetical protein
VPLAYLSTHIVQSPLYVPANQFSSRTGHDAPAEGFLSVRSQDLRFFWHTYAA